MRRGGRTDIASRIGPYYLTSTSDVGAAGTAGGRPCEFAITSGIFDHDPAPGVTTFSADGFPYNHRAVRGGPDGSGTGIEGMIVIVDVSRFEPHLFWLYYNHFRDTDSPQQITLYHRTGSLSGMGKPLRPFPVRSVNQDHQFHGGRGRNMIIQVAMTEGEWDEEDIP